MKHICRMNMLKQIFFLNITGDQTHSLTRKHQGSYKHTYLFRYKNPHIYNCALKYK